MGHWNQPPGEPAGSKSDGAYFKKTFLVVQDPFLDAESVALADLYFPVAMWGEKSGCVTNADRSVNFLQKAVEPPGEARSDFEIFVEVVDSTRLQKSRWAAIGWISRAARGFR